MPTDPPDTLVKPVDRDPAHGGVIYVGPSLTRSLLGVAVALSRGTA